jgi:oxygen-independent coproporphyrinogen-3 oxidase
MPQSHQALSERYIDALIADLDTSVELAHNRALQSIFIGGGTPSLMAPRLLGRFLEHVAKRYSLAKDIEITMEANPGTIEHGHFGDYRNLGINRLSMGIQSFDNTLLKRLGRIHDQREALLAIETVQKHFDNFNLDVMYALPGQSVDMLKNDLRHAIAAQSTHLSFYQLTIEPNTVFAKYEPEDLPDEDTVAIMQETVVETLANAGFEHYEISGYAKPTHRCRHNLNYWQFGDYLAAGAGAHSKITLENGTIVREARYSQPMSFMQHALEDSAVVEKRTVQADELPFEFMLNALRLTDGVPLKTFEERTGLSLETIQPTIEKAQKQGLMPTPLTAIVATEMGQNFLSDLQEYFL